MSHRWFAGRVESLGTSNIQFAESSSAPHLWKHRPVPKMPLYLLVFLSMAYLSSTWYYQRTFALQKLGKLLGSQVTPLMLARSLKHHMAATAARQRVCLCSGEGLGVELLSRDTSDVCHFSQHWWQCPSRRVICASARWQPGLGLISGGCERWLPETEAERSSQTAAQMPTSTTERIFPRLYCPKSDDVL